jgi:dihydroorotate dehydrogenase electron transfer subunit
MKKKQVKAEILVNRKENGQYYRLVLDCPDIASSVSPGQFVMIKTGDDRTLLLRRPLSVHKVSGGKLEFLYEVVGKGTGMLSGRKAGDRLDLLGPLGNGFDYRGKRSPGDRPVLVAGGMGVAPLVFLAEALRSGTRPGAGNKVLALIGAKTKNLVLCEKEFKNFGCDVKIATDDGSRGFHGRVTALLEESLGDTGHRVSAIYGCGPNPMLKEISRVSKIFRLPAQVSLEAHMACGIGACLGCVVNTLDGYKRVCKEGPVFDAESLIY